MADTITLWLFLAGLALFVTGDLLWLLRNTFNRPMQMRVTGALIGAGIVLLTIGLALFAVRGGGGG
ncbi:MAG: hypothetical protein AMXMBFR23_17060 [Chloroflexota bacterium]